MVFKEHEHYYFFQMIMTHIRYTLHIHISTVKIICSNETDLAHMYHHRIPSHNHAHKFH